MYRKGTNQYVSNTSLDKDDNGIQIKEVIGEFNKSLLEGIAYSKYKCDNSTGGNKGNNDKWHHSVNNPQLRGWYSILGSRKKHS